MQHLPKGTELEGNTTNMQKNWEKEPIITTLVRLSISVQINIRFLLGLLHGIETGIALYLFECQSCTWYQKNIIAISSQIE